MEAPSPKSPKVPANSSAELATRSYPRRGVPPSEDIIHVVLADDHQLVREGLRLLLQRAEDITIVGEASDRNETVAVTLQTRPDVLVLDLDMPGGDGADIVRELRDAAPSVRPLILTMFPEEERLLPLLELGARGYISKDAASEQLVEGIRVVANGEIYVRPRTARILAGAIMPTNRSRSASAQFQMLSAREREILRMVAQGYSGAEVAAALHLSTKTVAAYKERIKDKLGLAHRTEYVRFAVEAGILRR